MTFHDPLYLAFLAIVVLGAWTLGARAQIVWLTLTSWAFYASWSPGLAAVVIAATVVNFGLGAFIDAEHDSVGRKRRLWLALAFNLGLLAAFKTVYAAQAVPALTASFGVQIPSWSFQVFLPIGFSFFIFTAITYAVDIFYETVKPCSSFMSYALYMAFFPRALIGPITRPAEFLPQMDQRRTVTGADVGEAAAQFFRGFVKKVCVADTLGIMLIDPVYAAPERYGAATVWLAFIAFPVQLYADFSGCMDMGLASARLLGYNLPVNFKNPLIAVNPQDFWKRWHITLSRWLTDYIFHFTFGGYRASGVKLLFAAMATMLLCGLWHGANATFMIWGTFHGSWLVLHHVYRTVLVKHAGWQRWNRQSWYVWTSRIATFLLFAFGQVFSRAAPDLNAAVGFIKGLAGATAGHAQLFSGICFMLLTAAMIAHTWPLWSERARSLAWCPAFTRSVAYAGVIAFMMMTHISGVRPYIYMQF